MNTIDFSEWLFGELKARNWTPAELARRAGINRQVVSTYLNRQRKKPDEEILVLIAEALKLPADIVFSKAGLLPPFPDVRTAAERILRYKASELSDAQLDEVIQFIEFIQQRDAYRGGGGS